MSDQATPQTEAADVGAGRAVDSPAHHEIVDSAPSRIPATEVAFPWVWALVGLVVVIVAVAVALVTESQGIGLR